MKIYIFTLLMIVGLSVCCFGQGKRKKSTKTEPSAPKIIDYSKTYKNEWTYIDRSSTNKFYLNGSTARRKGSIIKIWVRTQDVKDDEILSKDLYEIDCDQQKIRLLAGVSYFNFTRYPDGRRERTATDPESYDSPDSKFKVIIPDTINEAIAQAACEL